MTNEKNEQFDFIFTQKNGNYSLNIQSLDAGNYKYLAQVKFNDEIFTDKGAFVVTENNTEFQQLRANYKMLYNLSAKSQGKFTTINNYDSLNIYLKELNTTKRVSYSTTYKGLNNIKTLLLIILLLLIGEWFIRKYMGSY